jgi:flagellar hook-associated protein 3 FlgL
MRISYSMIYDQTEFNINRQYESFFKLNEKVTTGKEVNRPSDNPVAMSNILGYRSTISSLEQYNTNIERGSAWLIATENALENAHKLMDSAHKLDIQMSNDIVAPQRSMIAAQVEQIAEQLLQIANTKSSGKYLFSGHKTETPPFTMDEDLNVTYHGDNNKIKYSIDETTDVAVNISGHEAFIEGNNAFDALKRFHDALIDNNSDEIGVALEEIDASFKQIVKERSLSGTYRMRFDSAASQVEDFKFLTEDLMVATEDTDMVKRFTDLKAAETAFNAALQSSSMITRLSLLNFI